MKGSRALGIVLIVLVGLLNFHIPHFLFQARDAAGVAGDVLELLLLANVLTALVAAVSIYRQRQWGWLVGLVVAVASMLLYLAQETVGLPGLPKAWLEPSRLLSLLADLLFVGLAVRHLRRARAVRAVRTGV